MVVPAVGAQTVLGGAQGRQIDVGALAIEVELMAVVLFVLLEDGRLGDGLRGGDPSPFFGNLNAKSAISPLPRPSGSCRAEQNDEQRNDQDKRAQRRAHGGQQPQLPAILHDSFVGAFANLRSCRATAR